MLELSCAVDPFCKLQALLPGTEGASRAGTAPLGAAKERRGAKPTSHPDPLGCLFCGVLWSEPLLSSPISLALSWTCYTLEAPPGLGTFAAATTVCKQMANSNNVSNGHLHSRQKKNNFLKHEIHKKNGVTKEAKVSSSTYKWFTLKKFLPNLVIGNQAFSFPLLG